MLSFSNQSYASEAGLLFDPRLEVNAVGEMGPQTVSMNFILLLEFRLPKLNFNNIRFYRVPVKT